MKRKPRTEVHKLPKLHSSWGGHGPGFEYKSFSFVILPKACKKPVCNRAMKEGSDSGLDSSLGRGSPSSSAQWRMQPSLMAAQLLSSSGKTGSPGGFVLMLD